MTAEYAAVPPQEYQHQVPRCLSCGWIGPWKTEPILLPRHIVVFLLLLLVFGAGFVYLLVVIIMRSSARGRPKICPNCGARNMHTFMYSDAMPGVAPVAPYAVAGQPVFAPVNQQYGETQQS